MKYYNHLGIGHELVLHKGKNIATSLNSSKFEDLIKSFDSSKFILFTIPMEFQRRADLISNRVYGTPTYDWLICYYNNIGDPFQELATGKVIRVMLI